MTVTVNLNNAVGTGNTAYTEQTPVNLFADAVLTATSSDDNAVDVVTVTITGATATESLALSASAASLAFTNGVTAAYNSATGVLTLTGSNETNITWTNILKGIRYNDTNDNPASARTVTVNARNNATGNQANDTHGINVTGVDDAPTGDILAASVNEDAVLTGNLTAIDVDGGPAVYSLVGSDVPAGFTLISPDGDYSFDASDVAYQSLADGVSTNVFVNYEVGDGSSGTLAITVTGTNDLPVLSVPVMGTSGAGANTDVITINDNTIANPYGSPITLAGLSGNVRNLTVTLNNISHTFQADINILLVGPQGQSVVLLSEVGGGSNFINTSLTFSDAAVNSLPSSSTDIASGTYRPTNVVAGDFFPAPAPAGGYGSTLSVFDDTDPNGVWQLYVTDIFGADVGVIADGWSLNFSNDPSTVNEALDASAQNLAAIVGTLPVLDADVGDILTTSIVGDPVVRLNGEVLTAGFPIGLIDSGVLTFGDPLVSTGASQNIIYNYDPGAVNLDFLAAGQSLTVTYTVQVSDGITDSATQDLTFTIVGTNDAPVGEALTAAATEGDVAITGNLTSTDVDSIDASYTVVGDTPAGFTLLLDGGYTFDPTDLAYESLADGVTLGVLVNYQVSDGIDTGVGTLTITVTGTNDSPIANAIVGEAIEDGATLTGSLTSTDVDAGATAAYSILLGAEDSPSAPAGFTLLADGSYTFDPTNEAYQSLAAGDTLDVVVNYEVTDGFATNQSTLTITVTGTNDAPVAAVLAAAAIEDSAVINGSLTSTDVDGDVDTVYTYTVVGDAPAGFALSADGSYTFDPTGEAYQNIAEGETSNVIINYEVSDGSDAGAGTLTIAVTGTNDNPIVDVIEPISVSEDGSALTGNVTSTDIDNAATATYSILLGEDEVIPAGFTLLPNGSYTFDRTDAAYQSLADGDTLDVVVNYEVTDGLATDQGSLTITVTGTNDVPVAAVLTAAATEDGDPLTGNLTSTDADAEATATYTLTDDSVPAGFTLLPDGSYTFDPTDEAYDSLADGDTLDVVVNYEVSDGIDTGAGSLTITVTGTNDSPVAAVLAAAATEDGDPLIGNLTSTDVDTGDTATYSILGESAPAGFTLLSDGSYTFDPTDAAYQSLADDQTLNVVVDYEVTDGLATDQGSLTITVTGTNDVPVAGILIAAVNEDGDALTGNFTSTDADADAEATYTLTDASVPAGFTLGEDGSSYTFDPTDAAYQSLAEGDTLDVVVNYEVSDGIDTSAGSLTITVTGTNDDPTGSSTYIQPTINENTPYTITVAQLLEGFSDVDAGQTDTLSIENLTSPQGTFTLSGSTYTFVPDNADYFGTVDLSYDVEDVDGGVSGATTSFTINPINDAPTTTVSSVSLTGINEDATVNPGATVATVFGSAFSDAKDAPAADAFIGVAIVNQITNVSQGAWEWLDTSNGWQPINSVSTAGALFLDAATRVRFVPAANFNGVPSPLQARLVETGARNSFNNPVITGDLLNVSGANSGGTTRVSNLSNTVTLSTVVNPIDDPTTITGDTAGTVTEDTAINFSGSLVATDADVSGPLFTPVANQNGTYGKFTILSNGTWQYNLANDNPLVQHLGADDSLNDTYTFNTVTGASQVVTVTINGSIDAGVSITGTSVDEVINGRDGNDVLSGGLGNDSLIGGLGNDVLVGTGDSTGLDTFAGGQGDDIYGIYSPDTTITENVNEGNDTVWTSVGYTLAENVENLYVVGALTGLGNSGDNLIVGFGEDNQTLEGLAGNDTLYGGAGDDTLNGGVGNDFLDGGAGTDILLGSGDTTGLDTFAGGAGDDVYGVYSTATTIIENASEGNDSVWTAVDYTLTDNIENLYLVGEISGTGNGGDNTIVGFGTDDHTISGGAGNDTLAGASGVDMIDGGAGTDVISGGEGADIFTFLFTQSTATATDRITDFEIGVDKFEIFGAVPSSFSRALDDSTSVDLSSLVAGVYAGGLTAGAAALVVSTGSIAGTYVVIDDGVAGFNAADDLVINITGASGALPTNPASVSSFFKV